MRSRATSLSLAIALVLLTAPILGGRVATAAPPGARSKRLPQVVPMSPSDGLSRALADGRISDARYALERVRSLFDLGGVRSRFGLVDRPDPRAATLLMRDLLIRLDQLGPAELTAAERILARPTDGSQDPADDGYSTWEETPLCTTDVCVHYVGTTEDAPPPEDVRGTIGIPDWVETTSRVLKRVWATEIDGHGYRPPKSDAASDNDGGNALLDVYLADIGPNIFGYCTSDDPHASPPSHYRYWDLSAYCVLDQDYAEFGYANHRDPLRVTAAHEFFHAVQFAYDAYEDLWLMESSAVWMEDEVYDTINDNRFYLANSPFTHPTRPLDHSNPGLHVYGAWIAWRFLAEYLGGASPDPTIVRAVWRRADGAQGGPDLYSTRAMATAVAARTLGGTRMRFRRAFADFAAWNARPVKFYEEGDAYPVAAADKVATLTGSSRRTAARASIDHLASRHAVIRRGSGVGPAARLRVTVDGPASSTGPEARVVVIQKSGRAGVRSVSLNTSGDGAVKVDFDSSVARVVVIMVNTSTRYQNCWTGLTPFACFGGQPRDQNRSFTFRAEIV